jgi:hypothetical protein
MKIWIASTCNPRSVQPCLPFVFTSEAAADSFMEKTMREEWTHRHEHLDESEWPYPGDWRKAKAELDEYNDCLCDGDQWGQWELTVHHAEVPA